MSIVISRKQAALSGLKRFYTARPCKFGHDAERFVTTGGCVKCNAERSQLFRSTAAKSSVSQLRGWFGYPSHPDDYTALLAYAQGLDMARGRTPHAPSAPTPIEIITPERMREMRALALGKAVDMSGTPDRPAVDASEAWLKDT